MKIHILIDFDNCLAKTDKCMMDYYQLATNDYSTTYDKSLVTWNLSKLCPNLTEEMIKEMFISPLFFDLLKLYEDAIEILNKLKQEGFYLHLVSCHDPKGIKLKTEYIQKYFPMIDEMTILTTDLDKSEVYGDIIVDDSIKALETANAKYKVCIGSYQWNKEWKGLRVNNLTEFYDLVKEISNKNK